LINKRIKQLRKILCLTQTEFGENLGVSRSVIVNLELDRVDPKDVFINHLCNVFKVNKEWVLSGRGEIFNGKSPVNGNTTELTALFGELTPELQTHILNQVKDLLKIQDHLKLP